MNPLTHPDEQLSFEPPQPPCTSCGAASSTSEEGFCCDCQYELAVLKHLREKKSVFLLTDSLSYYKVASITKQHGQYLVKVPELPFEFLAELSDFHLSIPSLVTAGISRANDAILRFNQFHKQHLALT